MTKTPVTKPNRGYKGNVFLRDIRDKIVLTDDNIEEIKKCKASFEYFIETYVKIINLDKGEINFALYKYQRKFLRTIHRNRKIISVQPRQSGKTQVVVGYLLWFSLFNSTKNVAIVANKLAAAREILERYQFAYERLPLWMQSPIKTWNKGSLALYNDSKVFTAATTKSGIRGKSCVTGDTNVCIENVGDFFYININDLNNNIINMAQDDTMADVIYTVYKTTNKTNSRFYVGYHMIRSDFILSDITTSGSCYRDGYLGSGKLIKQAIKAYGADNFSQEILGKFATKKEAEDLEAAIVTQDFTLSEENYNIALGGNVRVLIGVNNGYYGKTHSKETLDKIQITRAKNNLPSFQYTAVNNITGDIYKGNGQILSALNFIPNEITRVEDQRRQFIDKNCYEGIITINSNSHHEGAVKRHQERLDMESNKSAVSQKMAKACSERFKGTKQSAETIKMRTEGKAKWEKENPELHMERMLKINKNPEKIRKTAEKNTGSKRTPEQCKNISESLKGISSSNKGKIWIHNVETDQRTYINKDQPIPENWSIGIGKKKK